MKFFDLFRAARKMNTEGGDAGNPGGGSVLGGAGDTPAPASSPASDPVDPTTKSTLDEINADPKPKAEPAAEETPEAKATREAAEKAAKEAADKAPESYADFTVPEGLQLDGEILGEFQALAKELNLSQEKAQKLIDLQTKLATGEDGARQQALQAAIDKQSKAWVSQIKADPALGGENFDASLSTATKAMQAFGSPELRHILNESGLGNHPELFKLFHKIGSSISEDQMVIPGSDASKITGKRAADVMFGDVNFSE